MKSDLKPDSLIRYSYPILFILSPIFTLYSVNFGEAQLTDMFRPLVLLLGIGVVVSVIFYVLFKRDINRTALSVATFFFCLFLFEQAKDLLKSVNYVIDFVVTLFQGGFSAIVIDRRADVIKAEIAWFVVTALLFTIVLRLRKDLTAIAWLAGIGLVAPTLLRITQAEIVHQNTLKAMEKVNAESVQEFEKEQPAATKGTADANSPDLYIVVLDAYARQDILQSMYAFDNEPFLKELESRGFLVARQSRANYVQTPLAIGSALNLDYLTPNKTERIETMQPAIEHNKIAALLRGRGYKFVSIPTGYGLTAAPSADLLLDKESSLWPSAFPSTFEELLIDKTPLTAIPRKNTSGFDRHRRRLLAAFDNLGNVAALPYPKFVFAHILAPHPPFVFDAEGHAHQPTGQKIFTLGDATDYHESHEVYHREYAQQIQYVNRRLLEAAQTIQKRSKRPYVIVFMGDHGARSETSWGSLQATNVHEAFPNLFTVYSSTEKKDSELPMRMHQLITPINGLRAVMNTYFAMTYPNLPDRSFYSTPSQPKDFTDVTRTLDGDTGTKHPATAAREAK